jgi:hypothetical protein
MVRPSAFAAFKLIANSNFAAKDRNVPRRCAIKELSNAPRRAGPQLHIVERGAMMHYKRKLGLPR